MSIKTNHHNEQKGIVLLELVIVIAIIVGTFVYLVNTINLAIRVAGEKEEVYQANFLAQEAMEGVRNFRGGTTWAIDGLATLSTSSVYHLEKTGLPAKWSLVADEQAVDGFTQKISFNDVQRDGNNNIVESGGTIDARIKKVIVSISWLQKGEVQQIELVNFFSNWQ